VSEKIRNGTWTATFILIALLTIGTFLGGSLDFGGIFLWLVGCAAIILIGRGIRFVANRLFGVECPKCKSYATKEQKRDVWICKKCNENFVT
jgi:hypothetical protein